MQKKSFLSYRLFGWLFILLVLSMSSCNPLVPATTVPTVPSSSPTVAYNPSAAVTPAPTSSQSNILRLWLPPQWDPNSDSPVGHLLDERLKGFEAQFPALTIEVRIKANDGVGGMLDSLTNASAAAPLALPDLALLSRPLLEASAQKGILHPLNSYQGNPEEDIWYPYARQLTMVQNTNYGIPFTGDLFVLAYSKSITSEIPKDWGDWMASPYRLSFNGNDTQAMVLMVIYLLNGGKLQDDQGHPTIDQDILTNVLEDFALAGRQGKIPAWVTQTDNSQLFVQALDEQHSDLFYLWSSQYLQNNPLKWAILPGFYINNQTLCLASGWIWASPSSQAEKINLSFQLANFLSDKEFLAKISEQSGTLPTQPGAFSLWKNKEVANDFDAISEIAQVGPPLSISTAITPALHNALIAVLKDHTAVPQAVTEAIAAIKKP
ncbi:MAG: extracellular solute-binding protein [Anaerolineales bacterium]